MIANATVFEGATYKIEKHNLLRDQLASFPAGSLLIASEIVEGEAGSQVETWIAVPFAPKESAVQTPASPTVVDDAWEAEPDPAIGITVELMDGDEDE